MTAHRMAWLACNGMQDGEACLADTMSDLYVVGASPTTVKEAEADYRAKLWHRTRDGRHLCPECWESGQR